MQTSSRRVAGGTMPLLAYLDDLIPKYLLAEFEQRGKSHYILKSEFYTNLIALAYRLQYRTDYKADPILESHNYKYDMGATIFFTKRIFGFEQLSFTSRP